MLDKLQSYSLSGVLRAPDEGGAAPADSGAAPVPDGGAPAPGKAGGDQPSGPARPDWFPEAMWGDGSQFVDRDTGEFDVNLSGAALADAYKSAQGKIFTRKDDLKKEVREEILAERPKGVPESPDKYDVRLGSKVKLPEGMNFEFVENDPLMTWFKQAAHDAKLPQSKFDELVDNYVASQLGSLPDFNAEKEKLGEMADMRIDRVNGWLKGNLSADTYKVFETMAVTAEHVQALEEIMQLAGEPAFAVGDSGAPVDRHTKEELQTMMQDPRYWRDGDRAFIAKVQAGFRSLSRQKAANG